MLKGLPSTFNVFKTGSMNPMRTGRVEMLLLVTSRYSSLVSFVMSSGSVSISFWERSMYFNEGIARNSAGKFLKRVIEREIDSNAHRLMNDSSGRVDTLRTPRHLLVHSGDDSSRSDH